MADGEGVDVKSDVYITHYKWGALLRFIEADNHFFLYVDSKVALIVPRRCFATAEEGEKFASLARETDSRRIFEQMPLTRSGTSALPTGHVAAVEAALARRDLAAAMRLSDEAVSAGAEHPTLLCLAGLKRMGAGNSAGALPLLLRARELSPRHVGTLDALGQCLTRLERAREALAVFDAALAIAPDARLHFNKAMALEELSELDAARAEFERALARKPDHAEALSRLALLAAQRGDAGAARSFARRCLTLTPQEPVAHIALAMAALEQKAYAAAEAEVQTLLHIPNLSPVNAAFANSLACDILDAQDRPAEAFAAYAAASCWLTRRLCAGHGLDRGNHARPRAAAGRLLPRCPCGQVARRQTAARPAHPCLSGGLSSLRHHSCWSRCWPATAKSRRWRSASCLMRFGRAKILWLLTRRLTRLCGTFRFLRWNPASRPIGAASAEGAPAVRKGPSSSTRCRSTLMLLPLIAALFPEAKVLSLCATRATWC